ncbi:RING finger protein 222 [Thalassophryne amazonica]|uniref:RING finger protein 222 n=1 Tax=Thalassophryne amazonica TaxID=390379 RepID=UPI001471C558|nr:RING finger protein 222 [Thalassophryne amazonica]
MAFDTDQDHECPVCYESLSGAERTLSCGHVFCHDCLVKTLVSVRRDGDIRDTIICPVCRHLTFIKKLKEAAAAASHAENKDPDGGQTLEVPLALQPHQDAQRASTDSPRRGVQWLSHCFREISERIQRHRLVSPCHTASQIFIISTQGRPMDEEDALNAVTTAVRPPRRRRRRICTTARCLLLLLSVFTVLALVAATLPWIFLA